ncbi:hypothetical protein FSP39_011280 [Pinctada imbricata]|uniref:Tumor susceptibility gene 101 protein n=1 Tax=Pinctada imbricata TaxID=66713 RepID=A0AA88YDZ6_PINIB|nr:hypothetical protein FSP39_011280 [Pinctada imbricata]
MRQNYQTGPRPPVLSECQSDSSDDNIHELATAGRERTVLRMWIKVWEFLTFILWSATTWKKNYGSLCISYETESPTPPKNIDVSDPKSCIDGQDCKNYSLNQRGPCLNNGTFRCKDRQLAKDIKCSCPEGYSGYYCQTYKFSDICKRDIANAISQYKDLRPGNERFIFNNGSRKDLVNLDGTIPVMYKGNTYNIPICIWILDTHPYNPPMVFVKPTNTMQIKQGRNVDANGNVDLPYLRDWRYPQSDLLGLIQILTIVFGEEPPVFSRSSQPSNRPPYPGDQQSTPYPMSASEEIERERLQLEKDRLEIERRKQELDHERFRLEQEERVNSGTHPQRQDDNKQRTSDKTTSPNNWDNERYGDNHTISGRMTTNNALQLPQTATREQRKNAATTSIDRTINQSRHTSKHETLMTRHKLYKYSDICKRDITNAISQYKDLRPGNDGFIFNDGSRKDLVNLDGTIPVMYKGNTYNIPICIWILDTHPYNPPMVFVKPTNTMQIKQGRNVDANGKVDLPYLRDWRYPQSDLLGLIQILTIVFGEEPPVFSRSSQPSNRPPYPGAQQSTPYPMSGSGFPMPTPGGPSHPPPYPYPGGSYPQQSGYPSYNQGSGSYPGGGGGGGGYPSSGFQGYPSQQTAGSYPSQTPSSYPGSSGSTNPPYPSYPQYTSASSQGQPNVSSPGSTSTVTEEHLRMSLRSAVEDKIKRRLREIFEQAQAEMNVLHKTQTDLKAGKDKLDTMVQDLEKEKSELDANIMILKEKDNEIKEAMSKLEGSDQLDVDEAVVTTTPLYRQLLNSFAEEQALDDAIYYLGEALRKNVIDIDVFLKQVRELSRRQFMLRALIQKCREKAGLPPLA